MATYTPIFNDAFQYLLNNEGTKYTDFGSDRGGPTRYGIILATLRTWRISQGKPMPTANDVANLTQAEAQDIYFAMYWSKVNCPAMTDVDVATAVFDTSVLTGILRGARATQLALNQATGSNLKVDNILGPKTLAQLNAAPRRAFICGLVDAQQDYFLSIVIADPTQQVNHRTWRRRTADYYGLVP